MGVLPLTPLFANLGVMLLSIFSNITLTTSTNTPSSIVVLGGGLTNNKQTPPTIILNHYSQARAAHALMLSQQTSLPIITSGVESPWLRDYLTATDTNKPIVIGENASMNTCENAIFTAKLLHHHELPTDVYLVTDRYHMARARRQFALAGVNTHPHDAPLAVSLGWLSPKQNLIHSRRVVYEFIALARDIISPQNNCRSYHNISIEEISTPRRQVSSFSFYN